MPPIKEDLIDPTKVSFLPNKARKCIFDGKLFLFLDKKQVSLAQKVFSNSRVVSPAVEFEGCILN